MYTLDEPNWLDNKMNEREAVTEAKPRNRKTGLVPV